jgi:hypothetical protein
MGITNPKRTPYTGPRRKRSKKADPYCCPKCKSDQARAYKTLYMQGNSTVQMSGSGYDYRGNLTSIRGSGTQTTDFARQFAPPKQPSLGLITSPIFWVVQMLSTPVLAGFAVATGSIGLFCVRVLFGLVVVIMILGIIKGRKRWPQYQKDLERWRKLWFCPRCSHSFIPQVD